MMDEWMDGYMDIYILMDGYMKGWMDAYRWMNIFLDKCVNI